MKQWPIRKPLESRQPSPRLLRDGIALAHEAADLSRFADGWLSLLARNVGFDVAALQPSTVDVVFQPDLTRGMPDWALRSLRVHWKVYAAELAPTLRQACVTGVAVDTVQPPSVREQTRYFLEVVVPQRGHATALATLSVGGRSLGVLMLGRRGDFDETDLALLGQLTPVLSLGLHVFAPPPVRMGQLSPRVERLLSERDREVVAYVALGYTNPEIAAALGISRHTVRNRLAKVFQQLGASTRAELVALACAG